MVLFPSCDTQINYLALLYLDEMLKARSYVNAVLLTHDPVVLKSASLFSPNILSVVPLCHFVIMTDRHLSVIGTRATSFLSQYSYIAFFTPV